jgi:4-hydroxybenzoate polyprenyltransferase
LLKNPFIAFLKLIRLENLVIIAITQILIKYVVLEPINDFSSFTPFLFSLSIISTILIAAAGYIINDYFDVKTDKINRPNTVVVDVAIKRRWAMVLHIIFNSIGLLIGFYLALKCGYLRLVLIQVISILLLWFYSTHFKKQLLVGNIVVSFLTATIPLIPIIYDYYLSVNGSIIELIAFNSFIKVLAIIIFGYSGFAFLTSFAREVIKDMEDFKGDVQTGCKTMPIVWGIITSKVVTFFTLIITIGLLMISALKFYNEKEYTAVYYICFALIIPLLILIFAIIRANNSKQFKNASLLLKFIMLLGIAFMFIINRMYE